MKCGSAPRRLRICVIYSRLPFPMTRGDQLTIAHLLSYLHTRGHEVDFFTLGTGGRLSPAQHRWLESRCRVLNIVPHGPMTILRGLAAAMLSRLPLQVGYFMNSRLKRAVASAIGQNSYDVIYNYYLRTAYAVPKTFDPNRSSRISGKAVAAFLALQLSQTLNTRRIFENERGWVKRLLYRFEWSRVRHYEAKAWQHFTKSVLIGPRDVADIAAACRDTGQPEINNWVLVAHGTDIDRFKVAADVEIVPDRIVFSGNMQYQPNVQAALWFVERCWDEIRRAVPKAQLFIVGQSPVPALTALHGKNEIHVTGAVPSIADHIRTASVCINPMRAAGGMQNKLIEYMACGKAVVATSIANEGIRAPEGSIVIADDPASFAEQTVSLLRDNARTRELGQAARAYVEQQWTWEHQFELLENAFLEALEKDHPLTEHR